MAVRSVNEFIGHFIVDRATKTLSGKHAVADFLGACHRHLRPASSFSLGEFAILAGRFSTEILPSCSRARSTAISYSTRRAPIPQARGRSPSQLLLSWQHCAAARNRTRAAGGGAGCVGAPAPVDCCRSCLTVAAR